MNKKYGDLNKLMFKKISYFGILVVLFLNALPHVNFIRDFAFYTAVFAFLVLMAQKEIDTVWKTPLTVSLMLYASWALVTSIFAQQVLLSFDSFYSHLVRYLLFYFLFINVFRSEKDIRILSWTMVIPAIFFCSFGLIKFYLVDHHHWMERFGFMAFSVNIIGFVCIFFILIALQLLFDQKKILAKTFLIYGIVILSIAMTMTQSRAAILSCFIAVSMYLLTQKAKSVLILFIGGLVFMAATLPVKGRLNSESLFNDGPRMKLLYYSLAIVKDHPVMGVGFSIDTFKNEKLVDQEEYQANVPERFKHAPTGFILPHSMPLSLLVRTGIVGFIVFSFLLFSIFKIAYRLIRYGQSPFIRSWSGCLLATMIMFLISGLFEPVFIHMLDTIFYTICAMITVLWRINEDTIEDRC